MKTIKFSHRYLKFPRDFQLSKLLAVLPVELEDLSEDFRNYDTAYEKSDDLNIWGSIDYYPLPAKGDYLILLLQAGSGKGHIFTTIRRRTPEKEKYYRAGIGDVFECKIVNR